MVFIITVVDFIKLLRSKDHPGKEDIAVVQVEEKSTQPKGRKFKDFTSKFNIASEAKENEPSTSHWLSKSYGNKLQMYESTGKVLSVNGNIVSSDAIIQPGSSGSPILNSKHEAIGVKSMPVISHQVKAQEDLLFISLLKLRNSLQII